MFYNIPFKNVPVHHPHHYGWNGERLHGFTDTGSALGVPHFNHLIIIEKYKKLINFSVSSFYSNFHFPHFIHLTHYHREIYCSGNTIRSF